MITHADIAALKIAARKLDSIDPQLAAQIRELVERITLGVMQ